MSKSIRIKNQGLINALGRKKIRIDNKNKTYIFLDFKNHYNIDIDELKRIIMKYPDYIGKISISADKPEIIYDFLNMANSLHGAIPIALINVTKNLFEKLDSSITKQVAEISFNEKDIKYIDIGEIFEKFPNTALLNFTFGPKITEMNVKDLNDISTLLNKVNTPIREISPNIMKLYKRWSLEHPESIDKKIVLDSKNVYNVDYLEKFGIYPGCLLNDETDFSVYQSKTVTFIISSMADLSQSIAEKIKKNNVNCRIQIASHLDGVSYYDSESTYTIDQYIEMSKKMSELIKGIDKNQPDLHKFAQIYMKVMKNIEYDHTVFNPRTAEEKEYAETNKENSRNLLNGLIKGKAVCQGYAEIFRNACLIMGIDCESASGPVDIIIDTQWYKQHENDYRNSELMSMDNETAIIRTIHSWNKVCIDGVWYNCDATWDSEYVKQGKIPLYALISDKTMKADRKAYCGSNISQL